MAGLRPGLNVLDPGNLAIGLRLKGIYPCRDRRSGLRSARPRLWAQVGSECRNILLFNARDMAFGRGFLARWSDRRPWRMLRHPAAR